MKKIQKKPLLNGGANPLIFQNARKLRDNMTEAEKLLWEELKLKKLDGFKFRRQHPIGIHILDFYCSVNILDCYTLLTFQTGTSLLTFYAVTTLYTFQMVHQCV